MVLHGSVVTTSSCSLLLIYRPRKDERLIWPSWLTYNGRFTHVSGHPSAVGRAQDSESSPVKDQCWATDQPLWCMGYCMNFVYACVIFASKCGMQCSTNSHQLWRQIVEYAGHWARVTIFQRCTFTYSSFRCVVLLASRNLSSINSMSCF